MEHGKQRTEENTANIHRIRRLASGGTGDEGTGTGGDPGSPVRELAVRVGYEDDDHFRLTATVNDTAQLRWWLLSFGSKVEVLEPQGLREEMANQAYWMNRMYARPDSLPGSPGNCSESLPGSDR